MCKKKRRSPNLNVVLPLNFPFFSYFKILDSESGSMFCKWFLVDYITITMGEMVYAYDYDL